jgi:hypothetical protein
VASFVRTAHVRRRATATALLADGGSRCWLQPSFLIRNVPKQGALLMARAEFAVGAGQRDAAAAAAAAADAGAEAFCVKPGTALLADGEARCAATAQVLLSKRHVCVKPVNILLQRRGGRCKRHFVSSLLLALLATGEARCAVTTSLLNRHVFVSSQRIFWRQMVKHVVLSQPASRLLRAPQRLVYYLSVTGT